MRFKHFLEVIGAPRILGKQEFILGAPVCIRGKLSQAVDDVEKHNTEPHRHCVGMRNSPWLLSLVGLPEHHVAITGSLCRDTSPYTLALGKSCFIDITQLSKLPLTYRTGRWLLFSYISGPLVRNVLCAPKYFLCSVENVI